MQRLEGVAASGVQGAGHRLPHADRIQQALAPHRLNAVRAYTDAAARAASRNLGADAYTTGDRIAFASSNPDLSTVAHEAVHAIQQRAGAQRAGAQRAGGAHGPDLERRADAAADAIEHGRSPAGFLPDPGSRGSAGAAPVVQAKISVRQPQSFVAYLWGSPAPTQALTSRREMIAFFTKHGLSLPRIAKLFYPLLATALPQRVNDAASRMLTDDPDRQYDDNQADARKLIFDVLQQAYGPPLSLGDEPKPTGRVTLPFTLSFGGSLSPGGEGSSTTTFDYLTGLASSVPVPKSVGDYGSRKLQKKIQEHTPEQPIKEGIEEAFTGRAEALTRVPQDPLKAVELLPWVKYYYLADGDKDFAKAAKIAASKMSPEEAQKFEAALKKLEFDKQMKVAAGAGTSIAVGQGLKAIPLPAAKVVGVGWQVTGAVAASNKLGDVRDKMEQIKKDHPKGYAIMEEQRDAQLEKRKVERRERNKKVLESVSEHISSPFS